MCVAYSSEYLPLYVCISIIKLSLPANSSEIADCLTIHLKFIKWDMDSLIHQIFTYICQNKLRNVLEMPLTHVYFVCKSQLMG